MRMVKLTYRRRGLADDSVRFETKPISPEEAEDLKSVYQHIGCFDFETVPAAGGRQKSA